ncbi:MAG: HAD family phosphatase [Firmicutes bacterium]|nr:HAD family phosphatase [Bacillota bacterium]
MSIRLIALDIDGTTLNSSGRLTERTKDALERAIKSGVYVVMATGRCFDALPDDVMAISNMNYVVTSNGAMVRDLNTGEVILRNCLDPQTVVEAEKILRDCGQMVEIFIDGTAYIEKSLYEYIRDGGDTYRHREYVMKTRNPVDGLMEHLLKNKDRIENINIFFSTQEAKAAMHPILLQLENATVTSSLDNNWEIGGATTSKANALHTLMEILGIKKEEMMACGDSPNDIAMMEEAGISVAVGNAKEPVKKMASYISTSNNEDGVARAIEKFVFGEEPEDD